MTIYRLTVPNTYLDLGSQQAAYQIMDNFPPAVDRELRELTYEDCQQALETLGAKLRQYGDNENTHTEWLLSRIEFYDKELQALQRQQDVINEAINRLPKKGQ